MGVTAKPIIMAFSCSAYLTFYSHSIATDHNQLVMECMKRVASRHDLVCL